MVKKLNDDKKTEQSAKMSVASLVMGSVGRTRVPKLIAIGPNHRDNPNLGLTMEGSVGLKWNALVDLLGRSPDNSLNKYIEAIRPLEGRIREFYPKLLHTDSGALMKMMVLDGCFVLEFIIRFFQKEPWEFGGFNVRDNEESIWHDLLLLENQMPFFVLQALFDASVVLGVENLLHGIPLAGLAIDYPAGWGTIYNRKPDAPINHLLHLMHWSLVTISRPQTGASTPSLMRKARHALFNSFIWLLSLFLYNPRPPAGKNRLTPDGAAARRRVRSATELHSTGVNFLAADWTFPLIDVRFRKKDGILIIPPLLVGPSTFDLFRNLLSYEIMDKGAEGIHFMAYIIFMGGLVKTAADVALLEDCDVLRGELTRRHDVMDFFKEVGARGVMPYKDNYLSSMLQEVNEFCEDDSSRWRASLIRDYFSSPWTIIYIFAGTLALLLTILQTFFAILAYFRPPS